MVLMLLCCLAQGDESFCEFAFLHQPHKAFASPCLGSNYSANNSPIGFMLLCPNPLAVSLGDNSLVNHMLMNL